MSLLFSNWDVCRKINSYNGLRGLLITYYLRESLCRREEVLSAPRVSLFWKCSFVSLRFLDVFSVGGGLCLFVLGLVCFAYRRHPAFCISPVLLQAENSWPTRKRFDDRQSLERARHGLKKITCGPRAIACIHMEITFKFISLLARELFLLCVLLFHPVTLVLSVLCLYPHRLAVAFYVWADLPSYFPSFKTSFQSQL